jgi:U3 small nucleolar RNA-associated protein 3
MSEADFGFDENEWLQESKDDEEGDVVTEVLKDVQVTDDMGPKERLRLLQTRYPEFDFLANEFVKLHPILEDLQDEIAATGPKNTIAVIKSRALGAYLGALTMYFAILSSPAQSGSSVSAFDPMELRDHAVMDSLLQCREMWSKASKLQAINLPFEGMDDDSVASDAGTPVSDNEEIQSFTRTTKKASKEAAKRLAASQQKEKARKARLAATEASLADLDSLIPATKSQSRKAAKSRATITQDSDSDFGEEETLSSRAAAEKAAKKKSLRFYTSQIVQKANKRSEAGRDAGGDADLPYRERLRDRQARLNAEAEKRGKKLDEYGRGAALGGDDSGDEDGADAKMAKEVREEEDEYYDLVAQTSKSKKLAKEAQFAALAAAKDAQGLARVAGEEMTEDGKRAIGYVIQKNKGLAPKRKKEVRNPRVKKRMKYEEKQKKLSSMRAVYKGGEERGGYGGEKTGIKTGLIKSVKL